MQSEKENWIEKLRPHSTIRKNSKQGYSYIPVNLQKELGIRDQEKVEIPVYINANVVLMIRKGATKQEVMKGLKILVDDICLRWKEEDPKKKEGQ